MPLFPEGTDGVTSMGGRPDTSIQTSPSAAAKPGPFGPAYKWQVVAML